MTTSKHLEGKGVVVTGAGRGIGREIALAVARAGGKVIVNDLDREVWMQHFINKLRDNLTN